MNGSRSQCEARFNATELTKSSLSLGYVRCNGKVIIEKQKPVSQPVCRLFSSTSEIRIKFMTSARPSKTRDALARVAQIGKLVGKPKASELVPLNSPWWIHGHLWEPVHSTSLKLWEAVHR